MLSVRSRHVEGKTGVCMELRPTVESWKFWAWWNSTWRTSIFDSIDLCFSSKRWPMKNRHSTSSWTTSEVRIVWRWSDSIVALCSHGCRSSRQHMQMARTCVRPTENEDDRRCVSTADGRSKFHATHTSIRDSQRSLLRIVNLES